MHSPFLFFIFAQRVTDAYFADLTPEKAFRVRVFVDHCKEDKGRGEQKIESGGIPVVTSCAFRIQHGYNALVTLDEAVHQDDDGAYEDNVFILGELLKLAVNLDYSDEIGRRKMFALVRQYICSSLIVPLNDFFPRRYVD
jgi:condensin complex subunit 3